MLPIHCNKNVVGVYCFEIPVSTDSMLRLVQTLRLPTYLRTYLLTYGFFKLSTCVLSALVIHQVRTAKHNNMSSFLLLRHTSTRRVLPVCSEILVGK